MNTITDIDVAYAMRQFGGSFARALAEAYLLADPRNQGRIEGAFPDLWEKYTELAKLRRQRESER